MIMVAKVRNILHAAILECIKYFRRCNRAINKDIGQSKNRLSNSEK